MTSDPGAGGLFELAVKSHNDRYVPGDDRWRDQAATLVTDLDAQIDTDESPEAEGFPD